MAWGFFKKIVIADRLSTSVDFVYAHLRTLPGPSLAAAVIFFAFQLYADFSGYCDIAIGAARVLGIDLTRNFNRPYFSTSVADFWRRWHISLSSWFRDYLYFPLARCARRATRLWLYACLFITFLVSGLWHGAGWTFVTMGACHGFYLVSGLVTKPLRDWFNRTCRLIRYPRLHRLLQQFYVFGLVCVSWIFFRAPTISDALYLLTHLSSGWAMSWTQFIRTYLRWPFDTLGFSERELILSLAGIFLLLAVEVAQERAALGSWLLRQSLFVRSAVCGGLIMAILVFGVFINKQFIYFQF
jgi:D-alanyl-lipoteichoic acid acyltransferase DltB (MBOAT superfamily)